MKVRKLLPLLGCAAGIVMLGGVVACGGDEKPKATNADATSTPASPTSSPATPTATATPIPPTPTPFAGKVARFKYSRFNIDAPIDALGVNANMELDTPHAGRENTAVAWYDQDADTKGLFVGNRPGWGGNAVFSAHVYYINRVACPNNPLACPGPFQKIAQANTGDDITIVMEDGTEYHYKVISKKQYTVASIPMGDIISPPTRPAEKEWITMITCGGDFDSSGVEYVSRDVVVAERVS